MNTKTFTKRLKVAKIQGNARTYVEMLVEMDVRVYTCHTSGTGRFISNIDSHAATCRALKVLGIGYTQGNDAPRGGKTGQWIELDPKGRKATAPIRKERAATLAAAQAKEQGDKAERERLKAERAQQLSDKLANGGPLSDQDIFRAWWRSGVMHPAPLEVMQAKERQGLTWRGVNAIAKG